MEKATKLTEKEEASAALDLLIHAEAHAYIEGFKRRLTKPDGDDGCWLWDKTNKQGYGHCSIRNRAVKAHRVFKIYYDGLPEPGLHIRHRCPGANRHCVNPDHMRFGTNADNCADRIADGTTYAPRGTRSARAFVTEEQAKEIWIYASLTKKMDKEIAAQFGVNLSRVKNILSKQTWPEMLNELAKRYPRPDRRSNRNKGEMNSSSSLDNASVQEIWRYRAQGCGTDEIAEKTGFGRGAISGVVSGKTWAHVPKPPYEPKPKYRPEKRFRMTFAMAEQIKRRLQEGAANFEVMREFSCSEKSINRIRHGESFANQDSRRGPYNKSKQRPKKLNEN